MDDFSVRSPTCYATPRLDLRIHLLPHVASYARDFICNLGSYGFSMFCGCIHGDPAQARQDSPDLGRHHDGRLHLVAAFPRQPRLPGSRARLIQ